MTPEERELVADLFNRLAALERTPRDPDAERAIRDGLARAPNAVYALVQTALLQDEALKVADQRIAEMEEALAQAEPTERRSGSFLENMRDNLLGREPSRGSVPPVGGDRPMGTPPGYGRDRDPWGRSDTPEVGGPGRGGPGYGGPGYGGPPSGAPMAGPGSGGGSFLGTAAATAAGVVGGGLLMNSIRGMLGGQGGKGPFSGAFDQLAGRESPGGGRTPLDSGTGELARDAGLDDIGQGRRAGFGDVAQNEDAQNADWTSDEEEDDGDFEDDGSFDDDTDTA
jgi:uncharacterized protein